MSAYLVFRIFVVLCHTLSVPWSLGYPPGAIIRFLVSNTNYYPQIPGLLGYGALTRTQSITIIVFLQQPLSLVRNEPTCMQMTLLTYSRE